MNKIKMVIHLFAAFVFIVPLLYTIAVKEFPVEVTSYISMLLISVFGFVYCLDKLIFTDDLEEVDPLPIE